MFWIRSRTARPLSACFHSSLPLRGVVPSIFHWPFGFDEGRGGRAGACSERGAAARGSVGLMVTMASGCPGRPRGGLYRAHSRESRSGPRGGLSDRQGALTGVTGRHTVAPALGLDPVQKTRDDHAVAR